MWIILVILAGLMLLKLPFVCYLNGWCILYSSPLCIRLLAYKVCNTAWWITKERKKRTRKRKYIKTDMASYFCTRKLNRKRFWSIEAFFFVLSGLHFWRLLRGSWLPRWGLFVMHEKTHAMEKWSLLFVMQKWTETPILL